MTARQRLRQLAAKLEREAQQGAFDLRQDAAFLTALADRIDVELRTVEAMPGKADGRKTVAFATVARCLARLDAPLTPPGEHTDEGPVRQAGPETQAAVAALTRKWPVSAPAGTTTFVDEEGHPLLGSNVAWSGTPPGEPCTCEVFTQDDRGCPRHKGSAYRAFLARSAPPGEPNTCCYGFNGVHADDCPGEPTCKTCDGWGRLDHMSPKSPKCPDCTPVDPEVPRKG